jgi:hypothetical protein
VLHASNGWSISSVWIAGCFNDVVVTADIIEHQVKWKDNHGTERRKKY